MDTRQEILRDEEKIKRLLAETGETPTAAQRAWERLMDYYSTKDYMEGYTHAKIIEYIYQAKQYERETCECSARKKFVAPRTMYRYRKEYIKCFTRYYEQEEEKLKGK